MAPSRRAGAAPARTCAGAGPGVRHRGSVPRAVASRLPSGGPRLLARDAGERPHGRAAGGGRHPASAHPRRRRRRRHVRLRAAQRGLAGRPLPRARARGPARRSHRPAGRQRAGQPPAARRPPRLLQPGGPHDRRRPVEPRRVRLPAEVDGVPTRRRRRWWRCSATPGSPTPSGSSFPAASRSCWWERGRERPRSVPGPARARHAPGPGVRPAGRLRRRRRLPIPLRTRRARGRRRSTVRRGGPRCAASHRDHAASAGGGDARHAPQDRAGRRTGRAGPRGGGPVPVRDTDDGHAWLQVPAQAVRRTEAGERLAARRDPTIDGATAVPARAHRRLVPGRRLRRRAGAGVARPRRTYGGGGGRGRGADPCRRTAQGGPGAHGAGRRGPSARPARGWPIGVRAVDPHAYTFIAPVGFGVGRSGQREWPLLVGASPELLVARHGRAVRSTPLAGSAPRAGDPDEDRANAEALRASAKNREEHAIVVEAIAEVLNPVCTRLRWDPEPVLLETANVWHLATRFEGDAARPRPQRRGSGGGAASHARPSAARPPRSPARSSPNSSRSIAAATPGPWAGWTRTATASGRSPCAAPS